MIRLCTNITHDSISNCKCITTAAQQGGGVLILDSRSLSGANLTSTVVGGIGSIAGKILGGVLSNARTGVYNVEMLS